MKHLRYLLMAALVAMPLIGCDEDDETVVPTPEPIVGTVSGTVSVAGAGLANVDVTLVGATSQSVKTGSNGGYSFASVEAGSYGVTISNIPAGVSFSTTSKTTAITTNGQTVTVDFSGSYIETGSIIGTVSAAGQGINGVIVALTGTESGSGSTANGGNFSFTGLRAGSYTVTISNVPTGFTCAVTSQNVTVGVGEAKAIAFVCQPVAPPVYGSISGVVTVDNVGVAGVTVNLTGTATKMTETGANGAYTFTNLAAGTYTVTITNPDPAKYEFTELVKTITLGLGENGVRSFAGKMIVELTHAEISIQSITHAVGGSVVPVDLSNVYGQIEIALNITRGDLELEKVEARIGDIVVATQVFSGAAAAGAEQQSTETVVLNVPTNQVKEGTTLNGEGNEVHIPVVFNGQNLISAILYEVDGDDPIPTNEVPVVMNNPDVILAGDWMYEHETDHCAYRPGTTTLYCTGGTELYDYEYLAFGTVQPDWAEFDYSGSADCDVDGEFFGSVEDGLTVANYYECGGTEGYIYPDWEYFEGDYPDGAEGPDGSDLMMPYGFSRLGAPFSLSGETRWLLIGCMYYYDGMAKESMSCYEPDVDELYVDNKGPTVGVPQVAFNWNFDEKWVKGDYVFINSFVSTDGGVQGVTEKAYLWVGPYAYSCGSVMVTTPDGASGGQYLNETLTSDDAPTDSYAICGYAEDLLGNSNWSTTSNSFGVDRTKPKLRIHGTGPDAITGDVPFEGDWAGTDTDTPISPDPMETVFGTVDMMGTGDFHYAVVPDADMTWGLEAIDNRAGLDDWTGFPFGQTLRFYNGTTFWNSCTEPTAMAVAPLSDAWRRTVSELQFDCGLDVLANPGIWTYQGQVTDRAGNVTTIGPFEWLIDANAGATIAAITPATTQFEVGEPATFNVYGSDDLEIMKLQYFMTYPTSLGADIVFAYSPVAVSTDRWNRVDFTSFKRLLSGDQFATGAIWSRFDFTESDGTIGESFPDGEDMLPTYVEGALVEDAGYNPEVTTTGYTFIDYAFGGWTEDSPEEAPWPDANIDSWTFGPDDDLAPTEYIALHIGDSSVDATIFDAVALVLNDGGVLHVCAVTSTYVEEDNGINRFYTYTFSVPDGDDICGNPPIDAQFHAAGIIGNALLVTYDFYVPNPAEETE